MLDILNKLSSDHFTAISFLIALASIILAIVVIIDVINKRKKDNITTEDVDVDFFEEDNQPIVELPTTSVEVEQVRSVNVPDEKKPVAIEEIKYVEEDSELEKTRARLELQTLKEELMRQEKVAEEESLESSENVVSVVPQEEIPSVVEANEAFEQLDKVLSERQTVEQMKDSVVTKEEVIRPIDTEEANAIISFDELEKATALAFSDEAMERYEDEGNEPISIQELEELYNTMTLDAVVPETEETIEMNMVTPTSEVVEIKEDSVAKDLESKIQEISSEKKFQSSPFISPVYGIKTTEESITLEQTANLEKLNEEIKKTNEFLAALKELKKNLE